MPYLDVYFSFPLKTKQKMQPLANCNAIFAPSSRFCLKLHKEISHLSVQQQQQNSVMYTLFLKLLFTYKICPKNGCCFVSTQNTCSGGKEIKLLLSGKSTSLSNQYLTSKKFLNQNIGELQLISEKIPRRTFQDKIKFFADLCSRH